MPHSVKNMIMNYLLFQCNQPLQGYCTILGSWTVVFCISFFLMQIRCQCLPPFLNYLITKSQMVPVLL